MLRTFQYKNIVDSSMRKWTNADCMYLSGKQGKTKVYQSTKNRCLQEQSCICLRLTRNWKLLSFFIAQKPGKLFDKPHRSILDLKRKLCFFLYEISHNRSSPLCLGLVDVQMTHVWKCPTISWKSRWRRPLTSLSCFHNSFFLLSFLEWCHRKGTYVG